jgi:heptosyltransferase-2
MFSMETQPKKVIVFCPNWVGDVVMSTPVFTCLRENYPGSTLICVIRKYVRSVIEDGPWFDEILDYNDKSSTGFIQLVMKIRSITPDMVILLRNSFRSALIARMGGAKQIYGYRRDGRSILLSDGPVPDRNKDGYLPVPMVRYYLELCRFLKLRIPEDTRPALHFSPIINEKCSRLLERYGITPDDMVIGLNPGAKFGSSKCWPPDYFAQLAELFEKQYDCKLLLFVGPGEDKIAQSIMDSSKARIINTGPDRIDLSLLKPLVIRCNLLVTNDTGPRHYAVSFDIPTVVLMGPTNPLFTASHLEKTVVLRNKLDCSPCHEKECPLTHHNCMKMISPDDVLQASVKLLKDLKLP